METINIRINNKDYKVLAARSEEEREQGLMNVEEMDDNEGCLFFHPEVSAVSYWMKNTTIPLDIIFIDKDKEVISVKQGKPESEDYISENRVKYVLELNQNSGVEPGDVLQIEEDDDFNDDIDYSLEPNKMYVIGSDGTPQAEIEGGERIFSRKSTRVILRKAKRAALTKEDVDLKSLGRYVFNELSAQEKRRPQYVQSKE